MNNRIIDFHTHILPELDDGSTSVEMSADMLMALKNQGVDAVVLTPHYYTYQCTVDEFCTEREESLQKLRFYTEENKLDLPHMYLAAEVKLSHGLWQLDGLERLCIEGTRVILLEMPYEKWADWMYNEVYALCVKGYLPVLVHIERYFKKYAKADEILKKLLGMNVFAQCNSESFKEFGKRRFIDRVIRTDKLFAIGSDTHDILTRKPNMDIALEYINKKYGDEFLDELMYRSSLLINGKIFEYI